MFKLLLEYVPAIFKKTEEAATLAVTDIDDIADIDLDFKIYQTAAQCNILAYKFDDYCRNYIHEKSESKLNIVFINSREGLVEAIQSGKYDTLLLPAKMQNEDPVDLLKLVRTFCMKIKILMYMNHPLSKTEMVNYLRFKLNAYIFEINSYEIGRVLRTINI